MKRGKKNKKIILIFVGVFVLIGFLNGVSSVYTTTPIIAPWNATSQDNLICSATIVENNLTTLWGVKGYENAISASSSFTPPMCDGTYCYFMNMNNWSKIHQNTTYIAWGTNRPGGIYIQTYSALAYSSYCTSDNWCFAGHSGGYLSKHPTNATNMWGGVWFSFGQTVQPHLATIYGLYCDSECCYGMVSGNISKTWISNGTVAWGNGGGPYIRPNTNSSSNIYCDSNFCYAGHDYGFLSKTWKSNGTVVWGTSVQPIPPNASGTIFYMSVPYCDSSFCYGSHGYGYFSKTWKDNGTVVWGTGAQTVRPSITGGLTGCDDTFCHGLNSSGYITKIWKGNGTVLFGEGGVEGALNPKISGESSFKMNCYGDYCFLVGYPSTKLYKVYVGNPPKASLDTAQSYFNWYKNDGIIFSALNSSSVNGTNLSTTLNCTNFTKGDRIKCESIPSNVSSNGTAINSSEITILNSPPIIKWVDIIINESDNITKPYALSKVIDPDDSATNITFQWMINDINVENDTVLNVVNGSIAKAYLNSSISSRGMKINVSVSSNDGGNISIRNWNRMIWNLSVSTHNSSYIQYLFCDSDFCYGSHGDGSLSKIWKENGTVLWGTGAQIVVPTTNVTGSIVCDSNFCYGSHGDGNLSKTWKNNGTIVWGKDAQTVRPNATNASFVLDCDDTFCYGGHLDGYLSKTWKDNGTVVWGTGAKAVRPNEYSVSTIYCDSSFCFAYHGYNYKFTKTWKDNGTVDWGTGGSTPPSSGFCTEIYYCDDSTCSCKSDSYLKIFWKSNKTIISSPYVNPQMGASACDAVFCYVANSSTERAKYWRYNFTIVEAFRVFDPAYSYGLTKSFCSGSYCFGAHNNVTVSWPPSVISKVYKNGSIRMNIGEEVAPLVYSTITLPTTIYFNNSIILNATCSDENYGSIMNLWGIVWLNTGGGYSQDESLFLKQNVTHLNSTQIYNYLSGNYSKGNSIKFEVWCDDGGFNSTHQNTTEINVSDYPPVVSFIMINVPINVSDTINKPFAYAGFRDIESADTTGNLSFRWYVDDVNVENDTILNVANGSVGKEYLNYSLIGGNKVNLTVFAFTGYNFSYSYWDKVIWNDDINPNGTYQYGEISCDSDFCYSFATGGYLTKIWKDNGTVLWGTGAQIVRPILSYAIHMTCDTNFCYGAHGNGNISKTWKDNGTVVWGNGMQIVAPNGTQEIVGFFCDSDFCYTGRNYLTKTWKNNGTILWGLGAQVVYAGSLNEIFCDTSFCYGAHNLGRISKTWKHNGTVVWGEGGDPYITPYTIATLGIYCDTFFCYAAHTGGYVSKIWKDNGTILWGTGVQVVQLSGSSWEIFCDSLFCYVGQDLAISKIWKDNGTILWNNVSVAPGTMRTISCDDFFCYSAAGQSTAQYITKVYKNDSIIVEGAYMCSPGVDVNWEITDAQVCDGVNVNIGTGIIYVNSGGTLTLIGGANVTCSGVGVNRQGDAIFIASNAHLNTA